MDALDKNKRRDKLEKQNKTILECFLQTYNLLERLIDLRFGLYTTDIIAYLKIFIESKGKKKAFPSTNKNQ